jgi:hypothetical protein
MKHLNKRLSRVRRRDIRTFRDLDFESVALLTGRFKMMVVAVVTIAVAVLSGCVAGEIKPDLGRVAAIKKIAVVALESPPLDATNLPSSLVSPSSTTNSQSVPGIHLVTAPNQTVRIAGGAIIAAYGIFLLLDSATYDQQSSKPAIPLHDALARTDAWIPTVSIARETAAQLRAPGGTEVNVVEGYAPLPGIENRGRTWSMENWLAPLRAWYNDDKSAFSYTQLRTQDIDAIVEVGLLNYEIFSGGLLVQVTTKLVDPISRNVLGRSRNGAYFDVGPVDQLFGNDGQNYKEFFARSTRGLITKNLEQIGLLP